MRLVRGEKVTWKAEAVDPPMLNNEQWMLASLLGLVFIVMAALQIISFTDFKNTLDGMGLSGASTWAAIIILAELWGAAGLFKWRLSPLFRMVSAGLAILIAGFWFVENLSLVANGTGEALQNTGLFGRYLSQTPGWWTTIETTVLFFWTLHVVGMFKAVMMPKRR
jgi:hypothetical protein